MAFETLGAIAEEPRRRVSILGSTGSVGCSTIDLIQRDPSGFDVVALTANSSVETLAEQALALGAEMAVVADESRYGDLKAALSGSGIEVGAGPEALCEAAARHSDWIMAAIVGAAGLGPTMEAVKRGAVIGLANKETLVCAGDFVTAAVAKHDARLLPVDSEHNAIFQVLETEQMEAVDKIILTASGGPFRVTPMADMARATPAQAVAHPNWDMGAKISVDSATMMNKGLELIEARHLFGLGEEQIDILVHPQSVIHSMVAYHDGSVLAQLGQPDMRIPIAYTLAWPRRMAAPVERLDLARIGRLDFEDPDEERFPATRLARQALRDGAAAPTVLNAANEIAVAAFLAGRIGFLDIMAVVEACLVKRPAIDISSLESVVAVDEEARRTASEAVAAREKKG